MGYAPRVGGAYDVSGNQKFVVRGGVGLYFDRPSGNSIYAQVTNPPAVKNVTVSNASLASLGTGVQGAPALNVFEYAGGLPSSVQWNVGTQMTLPWSSSLDLSYVGQHAWNQYGGLNINAIDFGATFLPQNQDSTQAADHPRIEHRRNRSDARDPGLRIDQPAEQPRLEHLSLVPDVVPAPVHQGRVARLQRLDQPLEHRQHAPRVCSTTRTARTPIARIRRRPTSCCSTDPVRPHPEGQLRVGPAGPQERHWHAQGDRLRRQRLAAVGHLDGVDGLAVHGGLQLPERRRQREPDGLARLRRAHPHRGRPGRGLQQQGLLSAVQHGGVQGAAAWTASGSSRAPTT